MPILSLQELIVERVTMATSKQRRTKPAKPSKTFPLTAHNNGQWCKKIRGKIHFFGVWEDPQAALNNYLCVAADLHAGRQPRQTSLSPDAITVKHVCNHYLTYQQKRVELSEITPQWFDDCRRTTEDFAKFIGSNRIVEDCRPPDFEEYRRKLLRRGLTGKKGLGVHALDRGIMVVKAIFNYAYDTDLVGLPIKFGKSFRRSSSALKRRSRSKNQIQNGKRLFEPSETLELIESSEIPFKAMIFLGLNAGFGNADCANLPIKAINFNKALIEFPRPKNGIERIVPLWPETYDALKQTMQKRPESTEKESEHLVFLTGFGRPWVRYYISQADDGSIKTVSRTDAVGKQFNKLLKQLGLKRKGIGFYTLRHTFRTWADEVADQHAIHRIMGHVIPGMSGVYVEKIGIDRLRAVAEHVREKLFDN